MDFEVFKDFFINKAHFSDTFYANLMTHGLGMSARKIIKIVINLVYFFKTQNSYQLTTWKGVS